MQGYQLVKTEALPQLGGTPQFEPVVVARTAAGVLDFLRSHCTREGASYWLKKVLWKGTARAESRRTATI